MEWMAASGVIFADTDWVAWTVAAGGLASSGFLAVLAAIKDRRKVALDEWREIVARQDAHIDALQRENNDCRNRDVDMTRAITYLHGVASSFRDALVRAGQQVDPMVPLGQMLPAHQEVSDFASRSLRQNSALLHAEAQKADARIPDRAPAGGGER